MKITIETKDSPRANHRRGYHDLVTTFTSEPAADGSHIGRQTFAEYVEAVMPLLKRNTMWCRASDVQELSPGKFTVTVSHGFDSGD